MKMFKTHLCLGAAFLGFSVCWANGQLTQRSLPVQPQNLNTTSVTDPSVKKESWLPFATNAPKSEHYARDMSIFLATMFPSSAKIQDLKKAKIPLDERMNNERVSILKRLFVALAIGGLKFTTQKNNIQANQNWAWPLAVALAHGQRIIFTVNAQENGKAVTAEDFFSLVISGRVDPKKAENFKRRCASHGFAYDKKKGQIVEEKVQNPFRACNRDKQRGIDLPLGGMGNENALGQIIMADGQSFDPQTKTVSSKIQHGHLYAHVDNFGTTGAVMFGLEGSASGKDNAFGEVHNALSAFKNSKDKRSVMGGVKMKVLLGNEGPAEYGGMWVDLDSVNFSMVKQAISKFDTLDVNQQYALMKEILASDGPKAQAIIRQKLGFNQVSQLEHTTVTDMNVTTRARR